MSRSAMTSERREEQPTVTGPTEPCSANGPSTTRSADLQVFAAGEWIDGRFRIERFAGQGGMGQVYEAWDAELETAVAIKILRPEICRRPQAVERFKREVHLARQVTHPNVCRTFDFFQLDKDSTGWGQPGLPIYFLTMELIVGATLAEGLRRHGPLPPAVVLPWVESMVAALSTAHRAGVVHRDFKSSNVLLAESDRGVVVTDFGLAEARRHSWEVAGGSPSLRAGTPGYMAPEVMAGERATAAADIYSLGVVIFEMLTGRLPAAGDPASLLDQRPDLDPIWHEVVSRCLDHQPKHRFHDIEEVARTLASELRSAPETSPARPRPVTTVAVGAALVIGLAVTLVSELGRPWLQRLEDRWFDARVYLSPVRPPTQPLVLVLVDDPTLASRSEPLMAMADEMATALARGLSAGAAGVGIDWLLPESWSRSPEFTDLVVRHPEVLALAAFSTPDGEVLGTRVVAGLAAAALGPERSRALFGFANLDSDPDDVVRHARTRYPDVDGGLHDSFAARVARILLSNVVEMTGEGTIWIDFTIDWRRLERLSWREFATALESTPERFRDRFLLVGSSYTGSGDGGYRVPHPRSLPAEIPGPVLQALIAHSFLDGARIRELPGLWSLALATLLATFAALRLLLMRSAWPILAVAGLWGLASYVGFAMGRWLLPLTSILVVMWLAALTAVALRRPLNALSSRS